MSTLKEIIHDNTALPMNMINAVESCSVVAFALHNSGLLFLCLFYENQMWIKYTEERKDKQHKGHNYYIEICDREFDDAIILTPTAFPFTCQFFHEKTKMYT